MVPRDEKVLRTLCYSDIFDYPLDSVELKKFEIRYPKLQTNSKSEARNSKYIEKKQDLYYLKGRAQIVEIRKNREKYSRQKLQRAKTLVNFFKLIPSIKLIAITGAVAAGNAKQDDDIDLMIVTSSGWIWTTRFLTILFAEMLRVRRRPYASDLKDMLCFNMFMDEDHLSVPSNERDLFSANEVARVKIIWSRGGTEELFFKENQWVKNYLPNVVIEKLSNEVNKAETKENYLITHVLLNYLEQLLKHVQLLYMRHKRTAEVIQDGYLRFHPQDARKWILKEYHKRLRKIGLE